MKRSGNVGSIYQADNRGDELQAMERQLNRLQAKADLHGCTDAIEREIGGICRRLDEMEMGAGEDWLMQRDRELGRAFMFL
jgi:hypothetical protein